MPLLFMLQLLCSFILTFIRRLPFDKSWHIIPHSISNTRFSFILLHSYFFLLLLSLHMYVICVIYIFSMKTNLLCRVGALAFNTVGNEEMCNVLRQSIPDIYSYSYHSHVITLCHKDVLYATMHVE